MIQGYTTYATSRTDGPKLKQLKSEGAQTSVLDVSSVESIKVFKKTIGDEAIDVLINNAGTSQ
jgi:NAD(P)-dependent dehydrogenase (short-subunit alcohol dehydrogenase family)